jgi:NAD(P)-dependent dehydrogenase (short-subunit alcohol dehydrogenase family)
VKTYGGLDGLHANFAVFLDARDDVDVLTCDLAAYDETMRVNARGYLVCTRAALPAILERGGGSIVYTSSTSAYVAETSRVAYGMGKLAGHALMRHVAARFGPQGVRANCIAPGVTSNERWTAETLELVKHVGAGRPLKRAGTPAEVAALSALLMSDEGSFITGQALSIDGGWTMRP